MSSTKKGFPLSTTVNNYHRLHNVKPSWCYNWNNVISSNSSDNSKLLGLLNADSVDYFPMLWGKSWSIDNALSALGSGKTPSFILGFNEPDLSNQANLTVADAVTRWGEIVDAVPSTVKLVGPAVSDGAWTWYNNFYDALVSDGLRFDAIPFHCYRTDFSDWTGASTGIQAAANKYSKPIWVTEYGYVNWSSTVLNGLPGRNNALALSTLKSFTQFLESSDVVDRYCPYIVNNVNNYPPTNSWYNFAGFTNDAANDFLKWYASL